MLSVVRRITDRIGVFWTFILVAGSIGLVWEAATTADRDDTGEIIDAGSLDVFAVQTGDCFDRGQAGVELIESLDAVPCNEPHDAEAYATLELDISEYPGEAEVFELASLECVDRFQDFVGIDYLDSELDYLALHPSEESFRRLKDRTVTCAVFRLDGINVTGTMRGSGT